MIDEIFDRQYQAGRAHLNDGIDRAVKRIAQELGASLKTMHRIEWSAPWNTKERSRLDVARN